MTTLRALFLRVLAVPGSSAAYIWRFFGRYETVLHVVAPRAQAALAARELSERNRACPLWLLCGATSACLRARERACPACVPAREGPSLPHQRCAIAARYSTTLRRLCAALSAVHGSAGAPTLCASLWDATARRPRDASGRRPSRRKVAFASPKAASLAGERRLPGLSAALLASVNKPAARGRKRKDSNAHSRLLGDTQVGALQSLHEASEALG